MFRIWLILVGESTSSGSGTITTRDTQRGTRAHASVYVYTSVNNNIGPLIVYSIEVHEIGPTSDGFGPLDAVNSVR